MAIIPVAIDAAVHSPSSIMDLSCMAPSTSGQAAPVVRRVAGQRNEIGFVKVDMRDVKIECPIRARNNLGPGRFNPDRCDPKIELAGKFRNAMLPQTLGQELHAATGVNILAEADQEMAVPQDVRCRACCHTVGA